MGERLKGKVCLITGAARGQGAAEARRFGAEGATVYVTDVLAELGTTTAEEAGATFLQHDVTDVEQWRSVIERILDDRDRLDVLVNNAAVFPRASLGETTRELWDSTILVNQTSVYLGMQAAATPMIRQGSGSIINVSSVAGLRGTAAFAYSATKWAIRGMTKCAALDLGPQGIRVNSVLPGVIDTEMIAGLPVRGSAARLPVGRVGTADEVAELVLWLASDESSFATGAEFVLDGGMTIGTGS